MTRKMQFSKFPQHIEDDINNVFVECNVEQFPGTPEYLEENIDHVLVRVLGHYLTFTKDVMLLFLSLQILQKLRKMTSGYKQ